MSIMLLAAAALMQKIPPAVFATWNPADKNALVTLSGGNLIASGTNTNQGVRSTIGKAAGKWYWELTMTTTASGITSGIGNAAMSLSNYVGGDVNGWAYYGATGETVNNAAFVAYGNTYTTGDRVNVALDMTAGKIWFGKNGVFQNAGNPAAGTNPAFTGLVGTQFAAIAKGAGAGWSITANFGASAFTDAVPVGFNSGLF